MTVSMVGRNRKRGTAMYWSQTFTASHEAAMVASTNVDMKMTEYLEKFSRNKSDSKFEVTISEVTMAGSGMFFHPFQEKIIFWKSVNIKAIKVKKESLMGVIDPDTEDGENVLEKEYTVIPRDTRQPLLT